MKKRQLYISIILSVLIILFLIGCKGEEGPKDTLVLAGMYFDEHTYELVKQFNEKTPECQIIIKEYQQYENPQERFDLDLISGNVPDIYNFNNLDYEKYSKNDMLMDLYTLIDQDKDINRSDFFENILYPMQDGECLYTFTPFVSINGLMGTKTLLDNELTIEYVKKIEQEYSGSKCFDYNKEWVLSDLVESNIDDFVNWEMGSCQFDSNYFIECLEYANCYPSLQEYQNRDSNEVELIKNKKLLFKDTWNLSMNELVLFKNLMKEDVDFMGYPSDKKRGCTVMCGKLSLQLGISNKTKHPEQAWNFVRQFLTKEYAVCQYESFIAEDYAVQKEAFEQIVQARMTCEPYVDEYNNHIEPLENSYLLDGLSVEQQPFSKKDVETVYKLIESADHVIKNDSQIIAIIEEETGPYFAGNISANEAAKRIQSRVKNYLSEKKG